MDKKKKGVLGAIAAGVGGVLAGLTAGLLFAPKSGKETREDIKKKAEELKDKAEAKGDELKASAKKKVDEVRDEVVKKMEGEPKK